MKGEQGNNMVQHKKKTKELFEFFGITKPLFINKALKPAITLELLKDHLFTLFKEEMS